MKCVVMQYIEAIRKLKVPLPSSSSVCLKLLTPRDIAKASGVKLARTVHLSFVPDEEIGGADGMDKFLYTKAFLDLHVGCALDEGLGKSLSSSSSFPFALN
jgi:aminoacylase